MNVMTVSLHNPVGGILARLAGYLEVSGDELEQLISSIIMDGLTIVVDAPTLTIQAEYYPRTRGPHVMLGAFQESQRKTSHFFFFAWRAHGPIVRIWRPLYAQGLSTPEEGIYWTDYARGVQKRALDYIEANLPESARELARKCLHI